MVQPLKRQIGLDRCRFFISAAAPLAPLVAHFFAALGIEILEAYGMSECVGLATLNQIGKNRIGSVGKTLSGVEIKIAADGEIMVRGPNVFKGYYKDEPATRAAIVDGWLLTGDIGAFDSDGFLKITDRKKDLIVSSGGKNIAPAPIEERLMRCPGIAQAVVVGDMKKHLSALKTLDRDVMQSVAAERGFALPAPSAWSDDSAVRGYVESCLGPINQQLAPYETVKRFAILPAQFSLEAGEVTPTLKLKRRYIIEKYRPTIDAMYDEVYARV